MTFVVGALLVLAAAEAAVVALLLRERVRRADVARVLRASEERFRLILDGAPAMIWTARADTTLDYLNRPCAEFTGLPLESLRDNGWLDAVHPDDRERCTGIYVPAIETRQPFMMEYRMRVADGNFRWLLATGVPRWAPTGEFAGYVGCDVDITQRVEAEARSRESRSALEASHREIQRLAGRLIEAQDAERARVARDLHDDVSQQLAGLSIALSNFKRRLDESKASDELCADLRALHQRATALAQSVRHLSHDLHPTALRYAGLVPALTSHCAELERAHAIALTCSADGDCASIPPEVALCLYRIAQEALRNVIVHSGAKRADVRLTCAGDRAELTITDEGCGFDVARSLEQSRGLGLVSIRERARITGGSACVEAGVGRGTCVRVELPLRGRAAPERATGIERETHAISAS